MHRISRRNFSKLILSVCSASLVGCGSRPIRVGTHSWIGYESLYTADALGWLPASVELVDAKDARGSLRMLENGELDGATLTLDEVLVARAAGVDLKVLVLMDISAGADMVLARPNIQTVKELRGRRVAVEYSAVGMLVLTSALESVGLNLSDVQVVDMSLTQQVDAWRNNLIDAAVSYHPTAAHLIREGAVKIFDSTSMPNTILDVLAVKSSALLWNPSAVQDLVNAHFDGLHHIQQHPYDADYRSSANLGLTVDEYREVLSALHLPSLEYNQNYFSDVRQLVRVAERIQRTMIRTGSLSAPVDLDGLVGLNFLARSAQRVGS